MQLMSVVSVTVKVYIYLFIQQKLITVYFVILLIKKIIKIEALEY